MSINPSDFRSKQRDQWNVAAGGWRKWNDLIDDGASGVSDRLVELAGVAPGHRVLDVACGYGEPTLTAARAAGDEGSVTATDISAQMIAYGRERVAAAGATNIEFVESGVQDLDFEPDTFDAAVSRWGIIFDPDGEGAAAKVRTFLKPGAQFAIASWGAPDEVPFLSIAMRTAMQKLDVPPPPPGTPGPLSRPTEGALSGLLEGGGFSDVVVERIEVAFTWESAAEFTTFIHEIAPPVSSMIDPHPQDVQDATWAAITDAVRERYGDGEVTMTNVVLMAAGSA
jgi:SAM-dependent methyltransferase